MSFYTEPAFFVACVPIVLIAILLGVRERPMGRFALVASCAMLVLLFCRSLPTLAFFIAYMGMSVLLFVWVRAMFARGDPHAIARYRVALALQIAPLAIYKVGVLFAPDFPGFLGISYITFKAAQVLIEVRASIFWAREIRGIPSRVMAVTFLAARRLTISWLTGEAGWMKVMRY